MNSSLGEIPFDSLLLYREETFLYLQLLALGSRLPLVGPTIYSIIGVWLVLHFYIIPMFSLLLPSLWKLLKSNNKWEYISPPCLLNIFISYHIIELIVNICFIHEYIVMHIYT